MNRISIFVLACALASLASAAATSPRSEGDVLPARPVLRPRKRPSQMVRPTEHLVSGACARARARCRAAPRRAALAPRRAAPKPAFYPGPALVAGAGGLPEGS